MLNIPKMTSKNQEPYELPRSIQLKISHWQHKFDALYKQSFIDLDAKALADLESQIHQHNEQLKSGKTNQEVLIELNQSIKKYSGHHQQVKRFKRRLKQFHQLKQAKFWEDAKRNLLQNSRKVDQQKQLEQLDSLKLLIDAPFSPWITNGLNDLVESAYFTQFEIWLKKSQMQCQHQLDKLTGTQDKKQRQALQNTLQYLNDLRLVLSAQKSFLNETLMNRLLVQHEVNILAPNRNDDILSYVVQQLCDLKVIPESTEAAKLWVPMREDQVKPSSLNSDLQFYRLAQQRASKATFAKLEKIVDAKQFTVFAQEKLIIPREMENLLVPKSGWFTAIIEYITNTQYTERQYFTSKTPLLLLYNSWLARDIDALKLPGIEKNTWLLQLNHLMQAFAEEAKNTQDQLEKSSWGRAHHKKCLSRWGQCLKNYPVKMVERGISALDKMLAALNEKDELSEDTVKAIQQLLNQCYQLIESQPKSEYRRHLNERLTQCNSALVKNIHYYETLKRWPEFRVSLNNYCKDLNDDNVLDEKEWQNVARAANSAYLLGDDHWRIAFVKSFENVINKLYDRSQLLLEQPIAELTDQQTTLAQYITQINKIQEELSKPHNHGAFDAALNLLRLQLTPLLQRKTILDLPDSACDLRLLTQSVEAFFSSTGLSSKDRLFILDQVLVQLELCEVNASDIAYWQRLATLIRDKGSAEQKSTLNKIVQGYIVDYCLASTQDDNKPLTQVALMVEATGNQYQAQYIKQLEQKRKQKDVSFIADVQGSYYQIYVEQTIEWLNTKGFEQIKSTVSDRLNVNGFSTAEVDIFFELFNEAQSFRQYQAQAIENGLHLDSQDTRQYVQALLSIKSALEEMTNLNVWSTLFDIQNIVRDCKLAMPDLPASTIDINALIAEATDAQMQDAQIALSLKQPHPASIDPREETQDIKKILAHMLFSINKLKTDQTARNESVYSHSPRNQ